MFKRITLSDRTSNIWNLKLLFSMKNIPKHIIGLWIRVTVGLFKLINAAVPATFLTICRVCMSVYLLSLFLVSQLLLNR